MGKMCLITLLFVGIALSCSQTASAKEPKPDGEEEPQFTYVDPTKWAELGPGYKFCSEGTLQSPINIDTKKAVLMKGVLRPLKIAYLITNATLMTNGLAAQLAVKGKSDVVIDEYTYRLRNLRWHTPAEHTINGRKFVAELQQLFMATRPPYDLVIISTVYVVGPSDPIVASLKPQMEKLAEQVSADQTNHVAARVPMDTFSGALLSKIPTENYMRYHGSLTTPPCAQDVTWFLANLQTMTLEQAKLINSLQSKPNKDNARPIQPINTRTVQYI